MPDRTFSRGLLAIIGAGTLLIVLAVSLSVASFVRASSPSPSQQTGIAVCGYGKASVTPDKAYINAGVTATAPTAEEARNQAAQAMTAIQAVLQAQKIAPADIRTTYVSIQPVYDYANGKQGQNGFMATNTLTITVRAVANTGQLIDALTQAAGNAILINGIDFDTVDISKAQNDAQIQALKDAHNQAERIASAAGVSVGPPISINAAGCGTAIQPVVQAAGSAPASTDSKATTPVNPGSQDITSYVAVIYSIK